MRELQQKEELLQQREEQLKALAQARNSTKCATTVIDSEDEIRKDETKDEEEEEQCEEEEMEHDEEVEPSPLTLPPPTPQHPTTPAHRVTVDTVSPETLAGVSQSEQFHEFTHNVLVAMKNFQVQILDMINQKCNEMTQTSTEASTTAGSGSSSVSSVTPASASPASLTRPPPTSGSHCLNGTTQTSTAQQLKINTSTHKLEWNRLERLMTSSSAAATVGSNMRKMFEGTLAVS